MVNFAGGKGFEMWLQDKPREWAVVLASRAALRVLPLFNMIEEPGKKSARNLTGDILAVLRVMALPWAAAKYPDFGNDSKYFVAALSARSAGLSKRLSGFKATYAAAYAARSANQLADTNSGAYARSATGSAESAASAIAAIHYSSSHKSRPAARSAAWRLLSLDATFIENSGLQKCSSAPLWPDPANFDTGLGQSINLQNLFEAQWNKLAAALGDSTDEYLAKEDWAVWIEWYDAILLGRPNPWPREAVEILLDKALWETGDPKKINGAIRAAIRLEDSKQKHFENLSTMIQVPYGNRWIQEIDRLAIDPSGNDSDEERTHETTIQQGHNTIRQRSERLRAACHNIDEKLGWSGFQLAVENFDALFSVPTSQIPSNLQAIYDAAIELASFLGMDNDLRREPRGNMHSLPPDIRRIFTSLVQGYAPWLRQFPTVRKLDDELGSFLADPKLLETSRSIAEYAEQSAIISREDFDNLSRLLEAAQRPGDFHSKPTNRGIASTKNLIIVALSLTGSFYLGATSSDFANKSPLVQAIGTFLSDREKQVWQIMKDAPADIQVATETLLKRLKENPVGDAEAADGARFGVKRERDD